jgi:hypothetical protein
MRNLVPGESGDAVKAADAIDAITGQLIRQLAERAHSLRLQQHLRRVLSDDPADQVTSLQMVSKE